MMKQIGKLFTLLCLAALCAALLVACSSSVSKPKNLRLDTDTLTLSWNPVKSAKGYTVLIDGKETVTMATNYSLELLTPGDWTVMVKANGDGETTEDSDYVEFAFTREAETGLRYKLINNRTEYQLVGTGSATGAVVMEDNYRGKPVTSIAASALAGNSRITSFTIGANVREIGKKAFYNSRAMVSVKIPESVKTIEESAFQTCGKLESVTLPSGLTEIPDNAFAYCRSLKSMTLGNAVTKIGSKAFTDCEALTSVTLPDTLISLGEDAFSGCDALATLHIGSGLTEIPQNAFYRAYALTSVTGGANVTAIGSYAFGECKALTSYAIPAGVTTVGEYAFYGCEALETVTVGDAICEMGAGAFVNTKLYADAGELVYVGKWLVACKDRDIGQKALKPLLRADTVGIGTAAFLECVNITGVELPNVRYIGDYAFAGCNNLLGYSYILFSDELETIGDYAFYGCTVLDAFNFGQSLTEIGSYAFYGCVRLNEATLPDTLTRIGTRAFNETGIYTASQGLVYVDDWLVASKVSSGDVEIKRGTVGIADYCFYQAQIEKVSLQSGLRIIGRGAFCECLILTVETVPDTLKVIGDFAFYNCVYGTFGGEDLILRLPIGLEYIGTSAFYQTQLCGILIPGTVKTIGNCAFYGCSLLGAPDISDESGNIIAHGRLELGEGIEQIGQYAFYNCVSLDTVKLPSTLKELGLRAFNRCSALRSVTVALRQINVGTEDNAVYHMVSDLTAIGDYAFYNCTLLETVELPDSVTAIGRYAFRGCAALKTLTLGSKLETVGDYAFLGCTSLEVVDLPASVKHIGNYAFRGLTSATCIYLRGNVESIGQHAFYGCNAATLYCASETVGKAWSEWFNSSFRPIVMGVRFSEDGGISLTVTETTFDNTEEKGEFSAPVRKGFTFAGWATSQDGDAVYSAETVAEAPVGTTLYAVFTPSENG